jgi:hypothetical protein
MASWCFKTATLQTRQRITHHWYWQIDTDYSLHTAPRLFSTLEECVADARLNGFQGVIRRQHDETHPVVINVSDNDVVDMASRRAAAHRPA